MQAFIDGNEAAAIIAYKLSEIVFLYPITPSSPMGEHVDMLSAHQEKNIFGSVPKVVEMQSEAGAAGALHGAVQAGSLATTFTASQGLLLMLPNMFKIAGELLPTVFHVAARTVATHALSIFCDHGDVMAVRSSGFAFLCSNTVQEAHDFALIAHISSLRSRIPFLHFFDGFRTSHEINRIDLIDDSVIQTMLPKNDIGAFRNRSLSPEHPVIRGTAQNPDVFFQSREACNEYYDTLPKIVQQVMDEFAKLTGRQYHIFDYVGDTQAENIFICMGSGCETIEQANSVYDTSLSGLLKIHLFQPFHIDTFYSLLPKTTKRIAVLDRTKEPGTVGEPLYMQCVSAIAEKSSDKKFVTLPKIIGVRYGLSSKEFTPSMVNGIRSQMFGDNQKKHFTIGINDDVTGSSIAYNDNDNAEPPDSYCAIFFGLGSDGTVGANKNTLKIIGESTGQYVQGYFVYDSKKSGSKTVSHLRFSKKCINAPYLIRKAQFIGCHYHEFINLSELEKSIGEYCILLINTASEPENFWKTVPFSLWKTCREKKVMVYGINAQKLAYELGLGNRINTIMQACFFLTSHYISFDKAEKGMKHALEESYGKKGMDIVEKNLLALQKAAGHLKRIDIPETLLSESLMHKSFTQNLFYDNVLQKVINGEGDSLPVSCFPIDGTFPTATSKFEKRNIAYEIPIWDEKTCIQCGKCAFVCPHASIRIKVYEKQWLQNAPQSWKSLDAKDKEFSEMSYSIQVSPEDCTGCGICVNVCPAKNKSETRRKALNMEHKDTYFKDEKTHWNFFLQIPELDRKKIQNHKIRQQQIQEPLFEFSGACAGCGETPYVKLLSQLFGDRLFVANATGCSSIYGGNLPTTPWAKNKEGRGPAWANSLFEDNAEFGLGIYSSVQHQKENAVSLLRSLSNKIGDSLVNEIITASQTDDSEIEEQRQRIVTLKNRLTNIGQFDENASLLFSSADSLVKKSVWIIGGDGWAYDIGYGGLDHVLASGENVNILVLDTEVYSNTGGQKSKATPKGAVAKFAATGKKESKKDLGLMAMTYQNVYVAQVAMGAKDEHTLKAFIEAESYQGPSLIIAYSHCIAHGIPMSQGMYHQKMAVDSGKWLLYRFDPRRLSQGMNPLILDSKEPSVALSDYLLLENRFKILMHTNPIEAKTRFAEAQSEVQNKWKYFLHLGFDPNSVPKKE